MTLFTDNFTRTAASSVGSSYTEVSTSASSAWKVNGTQAESLTTNANVATLGPSLGPQTADQFAAVTLPNALGASVAVGVRMTSASAATVSGYIIRLTQTAAALQRLDSGSGVTLTEAPARTRAAGDRIAITVVGAVITAYINGTQVAQATDSTYSTGRPGMRNSGTAGVTYDDFQAGDMPADTAGVSGVPQAPASAPGQTTGVTVSNVTSSTAAVAWTATSGASAYLVEYRVTGTTPWTALPSQSGTSVTVSGLGASTGYDVRVTPSNTTGAGTPSDVATFTTTAAPSTPPGQVVGLAAGTPTSTTVPLTWTATATATSYLVEYRVTGTTDWSAANGGVSTNSYTLAGLTAGTAYDVRVTAYNSVGPGTPSATVSRTTAAAAGVVVETVNSANADGLPRWRALIQNLAGERVVGGEVLHQFREDFYGPAGAYMPPAWLSVPEGSATLSSTLGVVLKLATAASVGARAVLRMSVPPVTSQVSAVLVEFRHHAFSVASPAADWRIFVGDGNVGASAIQLATMDAVAVCSQGELNRTRTPQVHAGEDAHRRRNIGFLVNFATKEAWLMQDGSVIGYRDCASTWTDGVAQVGISVTATTATAAEIRLASMSVTTYI